MSCFYSECSGGSRIYWTGGVLGTLKLMTTPTKSIEPHPWSFVNMFGNTFTIVLWERFEFLLASPSTLSRGGSSPYPGSTSVYFPHIGSERGRGGSAYDMGLSGHLMANPDTSTHTCNPTNTWLNKAASPFLSLTQLLLQWANILF